MHGWMVMIYCCIIFHQVNTLSSRLNMDYSCTSKYFLTNQIEKTTINIIINMFMILDFKILSRWFIIEYWWCNTLTRENNWFLNVLVKLNFATPTPFWSVSCFVVDICLSNYNLNSSLIHQASYQKWYQWYLMHREVLGSIWKIGRYPIKVSEVLAVMKRTKLVYHPIFTYCHSGRMFKLRPSSPWFEPFCLFVCLFTNLLFRLCLPWEKYNKMYH